MEATAATVMFTRLLDAVGRSGLAETLGPWDGTLVHLAESAGTVWVPERLRATLDVETIVRVANRYDGVEIAIEEQPSPPSAVLDAIMIFLYEPEMPIQPCLDLGLWALFKEDIPEEMIPAYELLQDELVLLIENVANELPHQSISRTFVHDRSAG
ncbi:hypothetical protein IIA16_00560 [bacterium]|nr:hypothetical protein [bacterium]